MDSRLTRPSYSDVPNKTRLRMNIRWLSVLVIGVLAVSALALSAIAQSDLFEFPGDPETPEELMFVSVQAPQDATCGSTAGDTIRC